MKEGMRRPFVIAHRGASGLTGEDNTLVSYERAIEIGCDFVEFDVRRTGDGMPICFHDPEIDGIPVGEISHKELNLRAGVEVPTLKETVEQVKGRIKLDVDLKEEGYEEEVLNIITQYFNADELLVKSFHDPIIQNISACNPEIKTGLLVGTHDEKGTPEEKMEKIHKRIELCGCTFLSPQLQLYRQGLSKHPELGQYEIYVWAVNTPEEIDEVLFSDVTGIISDHPDRVLDRLRNFPKQARYRE